MLKHLLLGFFVIPAFSQPQAQQSLPDVIVKRLHISDPDISKRQSVYYNRKEEFHQVLVRDLGERTGSLAPAVFYVDFLAQKEKVKGNYIVEVRWVNLIFYTGNSRVRRFPSNVLLGNGTRVEEEEFQIVYPVTAELEILIYKKENDSLKMVYEANEPLEYRYETKPQRVSGDFILRNPPNPDKPLIFKELNLTYYTHIKETILNYFNEKL